MSEVIWTSSPGPQTLLCQCPIEDIFYGGARGGGKTSGALGRFAVHADQYKKDAVGILFRRTYPELDEVMKQAEEMYSRLGAVFNKVERMWTFPSGATLKFRHLDNDADAGHYQGMQFSMVVFEEAGQWPTPEPLDKLRACLRSRVVTHMTFLLTGNPGGPGHFWLKARYIDPSPPLRPFTPIETGIQRVFIPAKLEDNPHIADVETYKNRLRGSGPGWLVAAWLHGDWSGPPSGGYFQPGWMRTYVEIPKDIETTYISVDFAGATAETNDCTAIIPAGLNANRDVYVLPPMSIARTTPRQSILKILDIADALTPRPDAILVEYGQLWIGMRESFNEIMMERHVNAGGLYHIEEMPTKVTTGRGKSGRATGLSVMMEHGKWFFPQSELYETVIKPHFLGFTGKHGVAEQDDEIDACSHLAIYLGEMLTGMEPKKAVDKRYEKEESRRASIKSRRERKPQADDDVEASFASYFDEE